MGLFDKVLGTKTGELTAAEGFTGVVLCAVAADGVVTQEEMQGLAASLSRMRLFRDMNPRQVQNAFEKVVRIAREKGPEELLRQSARAVPRELRPTAFAVAADLLFADQDVSESERAFLERIQKALEVPDSEAVKIVEVVAIKNKG